MRRYFLRHPSLGSPTVGAAIADQRAASRDEMLVTIGIVLRAVIVAVHAGCVAEEAVAHTQVSALQQSAVTIREWSRAPSSLHPCQARSHHGV